MAVARNTFDAPDHAIIPPKFNLQIQVRSLVLSSWGFSGAWILVLGASLWLILPKTAKH
jgi:hypothetical protein